MLLFSTVTSKLLKLSAEEIPMRSIEEPARSIPVMAETDVLVIGGGPGGLSAALASARIGAETMLVERYGCFGGVITQSMIGTIAWYRSNACTVDAGGIGVEFEQRAKPILTILSAFSRNFWTATTLRSCRPREGTFRFPTASSFRKKLRIFWWPGAALPETKSPMPPPGR
jgi:glycine/D-amino acid oxidase-like deaminating enzyme